MKSAFVYHHLGLGDHFVCVGLVREVANRNYDFIFLPTKYRNISTVSKIYADDRRIICLPVNTDDDVPGLPHMAASQSVYRVGFEKTRPDWDVSFYESVQIPFEKRWSEFKVNRDRGREIDLINRLGVYDDTPFVLVHDTGSSGVYQFKIKTNYPDAKIIKVQPLTDSMLDWCGLIEKAKEVHCINSSFIHLSQGIRDNGVFYATREKYEFGDYTFVLRDGWKQETGE